MPENCWFFPINYKEIEENKLSYRTPHCWKESQVKWILSTVSKLRKLFGPQKILPYFHFVENGNCAKYLIQRIDISQRLPEHPLEMHHVALQVPCLFIIKQISLKLSMKHRGNRYYCPPLFFFSTVKMVGSRRYSWLVGWLFFSTANYRIQNLT